MGEVVMVDGDPHGFCHLAPCEVCAADPEADWRLLMSKPAAARSVAEARKFDRDNEPF